jgi:uncharacterized protein
LTQFVLIALGVLVIALTVVSVLGILPPMRIVPDNTHFDFTRFRRISFPISALLSIAAITLFFTHGLNFGIDFKGGTLMEVRAKSGTADIAAMRATLGSLGLGEVQLQQFGGPDEVLIRVAEQPGGDSAQQEAVQKVRGALGDSVEYRRVEVVGPRVSGELLAYGMLGLMLAIASILIYLWFRFEWQFALGAMIANVHDIVLTIGFMSITQVEDADAGIAQRIDQFDPVAFDHHARHGHPGIAGVAVVRRQRDPQLHGRDDVRRRAGGHLYVDLHCRTDPDLSRRRHPPGRRAGHSAKEVMMAGRSDAPHLPRSAPIDAYGNGGFAFADMSHRGSLLCLPNGIWAWPVARAADIDESSLARVFEAANVIDTLIIGSGFDAWVPPKHLRDALRAFHIVLDSMQTGPAIRTYNVMIGERRRVAAALIAVQ